MTTNARRPKSELATSSLLLQPTTTAFITSPARLLLIASPVPQAIHQVITRVVSLRSSTSA
ncbi:MAG: hypothetical protein P1U77_25935 [Rubripirellula sp.]|jgi:hypothetical protein|nr:hypothetical protein [Rubripirellula sp.]